MSSLFDSLKPVLRHAGYGAPHLADEQGIVHVFVKLPHCAVKLIGGPLPVRHFLFMETLPAAPVIGWFFEIVDDARDPLRVCTYLDVLDPAQAKNLLRLVHQAEVLLHWVDGESLAVLVTQRIPPPREAMRILEEALDWAQRIPRERYNFDRAKAEFQAEHSLAEIATWQPCRPSPG